VKILLASSAVAAWAAMQLTSMAADIKAVRTDHVKTERTKSALSDTTCMQCHGTGTDNMLPIRKTMNEEHFTNWVRGTRPFVGYTSCPAVTEEVLASSDVKKIFNILYK
jgi:mono/diheme cytochrome c family protein